MSYDRNLLCYAGSGSTVGADAALRYGPAIDAAARASMGAGRTVLSVTRRQRDWAKGPGPDEYKIVSVRLRMAEFEELDTQARALGLTNNMAVRIAIRKIAGFLETDGETRRDLDKVVTAIGRISDDLERLCDVCERNGSADLETLVGHRNDLGREFRTLDGLLRNILNTARRRSDGRFLLGAFAS